MYACVLIPVFLGEAPDRDQLIVGLPKKKKKTSAVQEMQLSVHKLGFFFYNYILQENMSTDQTLILVKKKKKRECGPVYIYRSNKYSYKKD